MKTAIVLAAMAFLSQAHASVTIDDETLKQCADVGGCVVVLPNGPIIPAPVMDMFIKQAQQEAYDAGRADEAKKQNACLKSSV